jgi:acetate---CoA ligase (ADP-forming)
MTLQDRQARAGLAAMLEATSVAVVGASNRPGRFGQRMLDELAASPARPQIYPVNPRYAEVGERRCYPSLADLPGPVDLVLLGVPDAALEEQLTLAARRGDRAAVIFGNAHEDPLPTASPADTTATTPPPAPARADTTATTPPPAPARADTTATTPPPAPASADHAATGPSGRPTLRERLAAIASAAGMELCGAGCMGFVNVARGLRAIGYAEPDPLPAGPVALVTHSGSVFSAMLRTRRAIGFTLAVSSGQELVTAAPAYLEYALGLPETRVLALVLEAIRQPAQLRQALAQAAERDIPVVLLTAGNSARGAMMVAAHSGALAAADGGWEALSRAYGLHRVADLDELTDTLELFAASRRPPPRPHPPGAGIATVHDSGLERAHTADLAEQFGVPFAQITETTRKRLAELLDPGLEPSNPLDVWGTGADTRGLFAGSLTALADDPSVTAVALAVDLVRELDGDESYPLAVLDAARRTDKPVVVLSNLASAIDQDLAAQLRQAGIPVLEGLRTGLLALGHLLDHAAAHPDPAAAVPPLAHSVPPPARDQARHRRGAALLAAGTASGAPLLELLSEYGIAVARTVPASCAGGALTAAEAIGFPVILKTDEPSIRHKSDSGGVILDIRSPVELMAAYQDLAARLGPRVLVCQTIPAGVELTLGIARDPALGPLIVLGAGGVLVEVLADRVVALPPVGEDLAGQLVAELRIAPVLDGVRGAPPADLGAIVRAVAGLSALAAELGDELAALDINPLICGPAAAIAVDALAIPRTRGPAANRG